MIIRSHCLIYNSTSDTALLSTYELREAGAVIDNISLRHWHKDGQKDPQCLYFKNGVHIPLFAEATLLMFTAELPNSQQYVQVLHGTLKFVDIGIRSWDPSRHNDNIVNPNCITSLLSHAQIL